MAELVKDPAGLLSMVQELLEADVFAFDTEFIRENTFFPQLELLQIATRDRIWLVDVPAFGRNKSEWLPKFQPLIELFRNPKILKIVHAAQADQECLYTSFETLATPTLDTAAAGSLCGLGENPGLASLLRAVLDVQVKKGHARTNWSMRPLPAQLLEYAADDVRYLVPLAESLMSRLEKLGRKDWAMELSAKWERPELYAYDPMDWAVRLARGGRVDRRKLGVLAELIRWREERVRRVNRPRKWVADDSVLMDLAVVAPKDREHLGAFRGLNKGEFNACGDDILAAIERGLQVDPKNLPAIDKADTANDRESRSIELLKCFVGILAEKHQIAVIHLLSAAQYLQLLRSSANSVDEWVGQELMSRGAAALIGEELLGFLNGREALTLEKRRVKILPLGGGSQGES